MDTYTLHTGTEVPVIGFGTAGLSGSAGADSIAGAIRAGYRYIDTAYNYENEGAVGEAIKRSGIERGDIQVASKLPGRNQDREKVLFTIEESLYRAGLDYFDVYLIHWPNQRVDTYVEAFEEMLKARDNGLIKDVGVSNFLPDHIDRLERELGELPVLNQVELHPYFHQKSQREYHERKGILTQSWSPLGAKSRTNHEIPVLDNADLQIVADKHGVTVAQAILRWHLDMGNMVIPKSSKPERAAENLDVFGFELDDDDRALFESLDSADGRLNDQDPAGYEEF